MEKYNNINNDSVVEQATQRSEKPITSVAGSLSTNVGHDFSNKPHLTKVGENLRVDLHDSISSGITGSTTGVATYQIKDTLGTFQLTSEDKNGKVLFSMPIDTLITERVKQFASQYVNYRFTHLSVTLRNVSPLASASGSIQFAYVNDPENDIPIGTTGIETIIRQVNSKQVGAKDKLDLDLDCNSLNVTGAPSHWKFTKPRKGASIFNRYGSIAACVRATPAIGDGAQFVVSVAGAVEFYGMTDNTDYQQVNFFLPKLNLVKDVEYNAGYSDEYGDYVLTFKSAKTDSTLPAYTKSTIIMPKVRNFMVKVIDNNDVMIDFPIQIRQLDYNTISNENIFRTQARTKRLNALELPYKQVKVMPLEDDCTAVGFYVEDTEVPITQEIRDYSFLASTVETIFKAKFIELDEKKQTKTVPTAPYRSKHLAN